MKIFFLMLIFFLNFGIQIAAMENTDSKMDCFTALDIFRKINLRFEEWKDRASDANQESEIGTLYALQFMKNLKDQLMISFDLLIAVKDEKIKQEIAQEMIVASRIDDCLHKMPSFAWVFIKGFLEFRKTDNNSLIETMHCMINDTSLDIKIRNIIERRINGIKEFYRMCDDADKDYQKLNLKIST